MNENENTHPQATQEDKNAFFDCAIGLWDELISELDEHKAEIEEVTEYFIASESWEDLPAGADPHDIPYTKLFQMFYCGIGKGMDLVDRINAL